MRHYTHSKIISGSHRVNITLVGVGGTGSHVLTGLGQIHHSLRALDHPGLFVTVFDDDIISEANIGRQAFAMSDVGHSKASVLTSRINGYYGLDWDACPLTYPNDRYIPTHTDILISCVDTAKARVAIANHIEASNTPPIYWLDFGNTSHAGQVVLGTCQQVKQPASNYETTAVLPSILTLYPNLGEIEEQDDTPSCSLREALLKQDLFTNSIMAHMGCNLLWTLLKNAFIEFNGFFANIWGGNVSPLPINTSFWERCGLNFTSGNQ